MNARLLITLGQYRFPSIPVFRTVNTKIVYKKVIEKEHLGAILEFCISEIADKKLPVLNYAKNEFEHQS